MMQGGSKTFFAASRLLPPRVRIAAIALYAFCRVADDLVDEAATGDTPLDVLQERLDAIYAGAPNDHVEDHALSLVVQQYKLPRHLLDALIEGFAWDAGGRIYDSIEDLHAYGARVAGSVGAMMSWIMGPQSLRVGRGHAADQHCPRCGARCQHRPALLAAPLVGRSGCQPGSLDGPAYLQPGYCSSD
jgi:phytoene synthase